MYASDVITLYVLHDLIENQFQALAPSLKIKTYEIDEKKAEKMTQQHPSLC